MSSRLDPRWRPFEDDPPLPPLTIGTDDYRRLPYELRSELHAWLAEHGLCRGVFQLGLREGYVEVGRYSTNDEGRYWIYDHHRQFVAEEWFCVPVRTLPPQEAFR